MVEDSGAAEAAKVETARQAVILAFGLASVLAWVWAQRWASDPDIARTGRMSAAKKIERVYARAAGWCWRQAEKARRSYESERG